MASEFRWAVRRLTKEPVYAISVIITLAIGLLLFTVTFAIIDGVLFQPLPYPGSRELFVFQPTATSERNQASAKLTWPEVEALRLAAPGGQVAAVRFLPAPYEVVALRRNFWAAVVDDRFFEVLGYSPLIGAFERDDFFWTPETELGRVFQPVIISHRLWGLLFNNQHDIISRRVTFAERMGSTWGIRVVGVLPQDFVFPLDLGGPQPDFLLPLTHDARRGKERHFASIARLGPDADPPSLRSALLAALSQLLRAGPASKSIP